MTEFEKSVFIDAVDWWNATQSGVWETTQELVEAYWKHMLS